MNGNHLKKLLEELCTKLEINLNEEQKNKFILYLETLKKWNRIHNLTAVEKDEEIIKRHFCDSLSLVKFFRDIGYNPRGKSLVDVGSGAGFPGVPLKIYYGDSLKVHLIESVSKKCSFLSYLKTKLGLDYTVHCQMAQEVKLKCHIAVSRALEVKGKKIHPLDYAYRLLDKFATELIVIMKGQKIEESWLKKYDFKVYNLQIKDLFSSKILFKFKN